ncbi:ATP-binding protein [Pseudorhodobacter wandonensis]|uniref:ATP-binding protein n=1 Tax=Pseudorhodobacter wandonensis TaxID=1120568 RepID=UPI00067D85F3|nr:adenylate/guanylate cyclase domain-containing protein [Pseudorhodobacter wandonensis]
MQTLVPLGGERRWTAVLMADLAGSTVITEQIGTENAYLLLTRLIAMAVSAVEHEGGTALTFGGDSLLASFGAPIAVEEASLRACRAALAFQAAVVEETDRIEAQFDVRPTFRIGISGGMVVVGHMGPNAGMDLNIMGQPVNMAARLQELAKPGQILLSDAIFEQVAGEVEFENLGPHTLRGIAGKSPVFALHRTIESSQRFAGRIRRGLVDMVGRRDQLSALHNLSQTAPVGWNLGLIEGPPGIGKSRLLHDLRFSLQGERRIFQGQCRAGSKVLFQPFADIIVAASQVDPTEGQNAVLAGLQQVLGQDIDLGPLQHVLSPGKDVDISSTPTNQALALRLCLKQALARLYETQPCLLVIEDVHWIDGSSRNLLDDLLRDSDFQANITARPILLTSRPEGTHHWAKHEKVTTLHLESLTLKETKALASRRLRNAKLSAGLVQTLYEKSEGNPLFIEEILRYLGATDAIGDGKDGLTILGNADIGLASGNLQHLVMSRVDALPAPMRRTLRFAAVQGRQFSALVLKTVQLGQDISQHLAEAADRGLIEVAPLGKKDCWRFRHALLRDAIYSSLLEDDRRLMHHTVGTMIEHLNLARLDEVSETLAFHFHTAQTPTRAAPYLIRSARKALQVYDLSEVDRLLLLVRDMLRENPEVIDQAKIDQMVMIWGEAMTLKGDFARAIEVGREFLPKLRAGGNARAIEITVSHYATALAHTRHYQQAIELALNGIDQARRRGDEMSAAWLHLPLLRAYDETNAVSLEAYMQLSNDSLHIAERLGETRLKMQLIYLQAAKYRSHGKMNAARERSLALQDFAISENDKRGQSFAAWSLSLLHQIAEENEAAVQLTEAAMPLSLAGTADAHVLKSVWAANVVLGSTPQKARATLDEMLELSRKYLDYNIIQGNELIDAIYHLRLGMIRIGWTRLCAVIERTRIDGNVVFSRYFHLVRAEVLLKIAGLMKEPVPAPDLPDRSVQPPPQPGLKDIATVIAIRFKARKLAAADLAYFRANYHGDGTGLLEARVLTCEALLTRNRNLRSEMLHRASQLAQDEGMQILQSRIKAQL